MQIAELIEKLNYRDGHYPKEFIDYILANKEEFAPLLIEVLKYSTKEADKYATDKNYLAHFPALVILAFFKEKTAFGTVLDFIGIQPKLIDDYLGEFSMASLDSVIASVYSGDLKALENFILDRSRFDISRSEALSSLVILFYKNLVSRDELTGVLSRIFDALNPKENEITNSILEVCARTHLHELKPRMNELYHNDDFVDLWIDGIDGLIKEMESSDTDYRNKDFISDVESEIVSFYYLPERTDDDIEEIFSDEDDMFEDEDDMFEKIPYSHHPDTYVRESPKIGRNDPCHCGSGKKYKKCCGK